MIDLDQVVRHRGKRLLDAEGDEVGEIREIYVDDDTREPRWVLVEIGGVARAPHFVPLDGAEAVGDDLRVRYAKEQIEGAPAIDLGDLHLDEDEEQLLYAYYGQERRGRQTAAGAPVPPGETVAEERGEPEAPVAAAEPEEPVVTEEPVATEEPVETEEPAPPQPVAREEVDVGTAAAPGPPVEPPRAEHPGATAAAAARSPRSPVAAVAAAVSTLAAVAALVRRRQAGAQAPAAVRGTLRWGGLAALLLAIRRLRSRRRRRRARRAAGRGLTARDLMTTAVDCVSELETLEEAARTMARLDVGVLPICGVDRRLKGVVTDRDIVVTAVADGRDPARVAIGELVRGEPVTVGVDASVDEVLEAMARHGVRRVPVVEGRYLVGMISQADVAVHVDQERTGALVEAVTRAP